MLAMQGGRSTRNKSDEAFAQIADSEATGTKRMMGERDKVQMAKFTEDRSEHWARDWLQGRLTAPTPSYAAQTPPKGYQRLLV